MAAGPSPGALGASFSGCVCEDILFHLFSFLGDISQTFPSPFEATCVRVAPTILEPTAFALGRSHHTLPARRSACFVLLFVLFSLTFPSDFNFFPSLSAGSSPPEVLRGGAVTGKRDPGSARPGPAAALRPAPGARGLKMAALGLLLQAAAGCGSAGPLRLCRRYRGARGLCSRLPAPESTEEARQEEEEEPQPAATAAAGGEGQDGGAAMGMGEAAGDKPNRHKPKRVKPSRNGLS